MMQVPNELITFLPCPTPKAWVENILNNINILLIDHAQCEKKAALSAISLISNYPEYADLLDKMSKLAREELLHFEKVLAIMQARNIRFENLSAARYAKGLRTDIRPEEPHRLVDTLIIGAFIEARSCERFAVLIPHLDDELALFYQSLLKSEARHFEDYLDLATAHSEEPITARVEHFRQLEHQLITSPDMQVRFHSGVPASTL